MKTIFIDLDDTIADFQNAPVFTGVEVDDSKMYEPGFFLSLKPVAGALVAVRKLIKLGFDVHLLTQPVAHSAHSASEKMQWVGMWIPELLPKLHMVQDKGIVKGDYLIDDNHYKWAAKFEANGGKFLHFCYLRNDSDNNRLFWDKMVEYLNEEMLFSKAEK